MSDAPIGKLGEPRCSSDCFAKEEKNSVAPTEHDYTVFQPVSLADVRYKLVLSNIAYVLPKYERLISTCFTLLHIHALFELEFSFSCH